MRFYNQQHQYYCGIDLHVKTMYVCILNASGDVLVHRNVRATPEAFRHLVAPYRGGLVVAAECTFTWYWLADVWATDDIPFVLGHALAMKAIHGGKAKNDRIDSRKIAGLLRGGLLPQAYAYPAAMRGTRDLMRRRLHFVRNRAELLTHIRNTRSQYNLPPLPHTLRLPASRALVGQPFADPSVRASLEADVAMLDHYDRVIGDLEVRIGRDARRHDAAAFARLRSVPGIGEILGLTILYEVHDIGRFSRVQEFASYARLVKCGSESAGKITGTRGAKIGNVYLKWAFSEAAVQFLRHTREGKPLLRRILKRHGKGKALSILAHKLGRAVFYMWVRETNFSMERFVA
jgi:transposase